ncbi:hypothetical protein R5R35_013574 [Gryllus longicercus]|uniref:Uncharacterized protein n=1 Tax=Gryllus longicercus TaxID=2509291 RepID=A0AAN9VMP1_9ORTH
MKLARNNSIAPTLALNYTDTVHEGWKNAVMLRSEINPKDGRFNIVIRIPQYRVQGRYQITGSIIGIPLEGSGHFEATGINMTNDMLMQGHLQERRGEKFFVIDDFSQKTHLDTMSVYLYNLFNNTRLANATNRLLNENHRAILDGEGGKLVNVLWGKLHEGLIQRIFDKVPYRIMFPDLD